MATASNQQQPGTGGQSRLDRYRDMINWQETAIAGVGAWIAGLVLTALVLMIAGVTDQLGDDISILDISAWAFFESLGGPIEPANGEVEILAQITTSSYMLLDTDWWGAGLAVHGLVPLIVLAIAGYFLASRHLRRGDARTPLEGVLAGASLSLVFAAIVTVSLLLFGHDTISVSIPVAFLVALMYSLVASSAGATLASSDTIRSMWGFLGGIGAFVLAFVLWYVLEDPFEEFPGESFSDLDESVEYFGFFAEFVGTHGLEEGALLPDWYVMVALLVVGAGIAYKYQRTDPVAGMGQGAKLGVGYVLPVFLVLLAYAGTRARQINDTVEGDWPGHIIMELNLMIGTAPLAIILAGIIYPATFGAIGGAIGAKVFESQQAETPPTGQQGTHTNQQGSQQGTSPGHSEHQQGHHDGQQQNQQVYADERDATNEPPAEDELYHEKDDTPENPSV